MPTLKLTLQYDGSEFVGWQRQAIGRSVQGELEEALARLDGAAVSVVGAGRTDAGVHAIAQVASATVDRAMAPGERRAALNALLPTSVRVTRVEEVAPDFNARFCARAKLYRYRLRTGAFAGPFDRQYAWHVRGRLDLSAMTAAGERLEGRHDFSAFRSTGSDVVSTERTIHACRIIPSRLTDPPFLPAPAVPCPSTHDSDGPGLVVFDVRGDGFLRHMVRTMVGTIVEVGLGRRSVDSVGVALASGRREDAGQTAPSRGLFLVRVEF